MTKFEIGEIVFDRINDITNPGEVVEILKTAEETFFKVLFCRVEGRLVSGVFFNFKTEKTVWHTENSIEK